MGPYKQPSLTNTQYFLTIVDDYNRANWTFLLKFKTKFTTTLAHFFNMVQNQFQKTVKVMRSDNGSDFVSHHTQQLLSNLGIIHHKTCPYIPQQNGIAEKKHQHLFVSDLIFKIIILTHLDSNLIYHI